MNAGPGIRALLTLIVLSLCALARADDVVPARVGHVVDRPGVLSAEQRAALDHKLVRFKADNGAEIAVLIVDTTGDEIIEQFSLRVARAWKLGRATHSDGVLLTVAIRDRRMRIEVGTGLELTLTEAVCKSIVAETLKPAFRKAQYFAGIDQAVDRLMGLIRPRAP